MSERRITIKGPQGEYEVVLTKPGTTLGRSSQSDIVLVDQSVSRVHAIIEALDEGYQVRDLNSSNGTRLNGQMLTEPSQLYLGDIIGIGHHQVTVEFGNPRVAEIIEAEELTAEDLVDEDQEGPIPIEADPDPELDLVNMNPFELAVGADDDTKAELTRLANQLPSQGFGASDVELTDGKGSTVHGGGSKRKSLSDPGGAVELLRLLLMLSSRARATDIHLEPRERAHAVRLRIDGLMVDITTVTAEVGIRIATLVKVLCEVDIAQRKIVQEGGFGAKMPAENQPGRSHRVDYRASFAPAVFGQKMVVRILDSSGVPTRLNDLGLPIRMGEMVDKIIHRESGMVLVVGPTGSGKTTTLYSLLRSIDLTRRNVVTIEDPVEVHLDGITQIAVDERHDRSFLQLLRSVLRQDPDVILVGEVRDGEAARVAMQAAITGHMVFSTLHTRDTIGTIFRLRDLGVEPYMMAQSLQLVIAQRLTRKLCEHCKVAVKPTPAQLRLMGPAHVNLKKIFKAVGCPRCLGTGHWGRRAFFELLSNSDSLTRAILGNSNQDDLQRVITAGDFVSLRQSAYQLVADGYVALEEVAGEWGTAK